MRCITLLLLSLLFSPTARAQEEDYHANTKSSTVLIISADAAGDIIGRGTGFYVDEGIIVTNIHVIDGYARYYRIYTTNDDGTYDDGCFKDINRSDVKLNLEDDVAYIRAYVDCDHGSVYFADKDPPIGSDISIYGYPAPSGFYSSFDLLRTDGKILEETDATVGLKSYRGPWYRTDAIIHGGNSGGPVVHNGLVVGIAVAANVNAAGEHLDGIFIPVSIIRSGLENANNSSFGYTPQQMQKNTVYTEPETAYKYGNTTDPFNPLRVTKSATNGDCSESLGHGGEATGAGGCRCKPAFHVSKDGKLCVDGAEGYIDPYSDLIERQTSTVGLNKDANVLPNDIFEDITKIHPYSSAIEWGRDSGILSGYPDGTFRPDNSVNRAEFLKIVLEAAGADVSQASATFNFPDVDASAWYTPYVRYAKEQGIVQGYPDGTFRPEQTVNVAEALKMAYAALHVQTDRVRGEWYERFLQHAKERAILFSNDIDIGGDMTRKDVVWIVWKLQ